MKLDPPNFAQVMMVDCLRETMVERRMDVTNWSAGRIVMLPESECSNVPQRVRLVASERRRVPDPMTHWRVFPIMRPGQLDGLLHGRIRNTGRWIAFRQGRDPVATERELRRVKPQLAFVTGALLFLMLVDMARFALVHFSH